jgi:hypothetical protein
MLIRKSSASKVVGPILGVSKRAAVTIVRIPQPLPGPRDILSGPNQNFPTVARHATVIDAYRIIAQDIAAKGLARNAVILQCLAFVPKNLNRMPEPGDGNYWLMYQAMRALIAGYSVPVVVPSGNMAVSYAARLLYFHWCKY